MLGILGQYQESFGRYNPIEGAMQKKIEEIINDCVISAFGEENEKISRFAFVVMQELKRRNIIEIVDKITVNYYRDVLGKEPPLEKPREVIRKYERTPTDDIVETGVSSYEMIDNDASVTLKNGRKIIYKNITPKNKATLDMIVQFANA